MIITFLTTKVRFSGARQSLNLLPLTFTNLSVGQNVNYKSTSADILTLEFDHLWSVRLGDGVDG